MYVMWKKMLTNMYNSTERGKSIFFSDLIITILLLKDDGDSSVRVKLEVGNDWQRKKRR